MPHGKHLLGLWLIFKHNSGQKHVENKPLKTHVDRNVLLLQQLRGFCCSAAHSWLICHLSVHLFTYVWVERCFPDIGAEAAARRVLKAGSAVALVLCCNFEQSLLLRTGGVTWDRRSNTYRRCPAGSHVGPKPDCLCAFVGEFCTNVWADQLHVSQLWVPY